MSNKVSLSQIWSSSRSELEKIANFANLTDVADLRKLRVEVTLVYLRSQNLLPNDSLFASDPRFYHTLLADEFQEGVETLSPPLEEGKTIENEELAKHFDRLNALYTELGDKYRADTFSRGAKAIRENPEKITPQNKLPKIKGLGPSTYDEITDFFNNPQTPRLLELLKKAPEAERAAILELFEGVHGIGPIIALELYNAGYRKLEQLTNLTAAQQIGVKYYLHFKERIPRSEIVEYDILLSRLFPRDLHWLIAGSYRRCKRTSGDIDIIFKSNNSNDLANFVQQLVNNGIITDSIAIGPRKFMGVCKLPGNRIYRRIDIRIFNDDEWAFGILYNTGSGNFNKTMRTLALQFNLSLNEYALTKTDSPYDTSPANSEREIFALLDIPYIMPRFRE